MNNLPSRWRLWIILGLLVSVGTSVVSPHSFVEVSDTVTVLRGSQADLTQVLSFHNPPTQCNVRHISKNGHSCGEVSPNQFNCKTYQRPILYQHYGCMSDRELLTFQLSVLPQNYTTMGYSNEHTKALIFSIDIIVESSGLPPINLSRTEHSVEKQIDSQLPHSFRIVFPQGMVDKCHYEIVSDWSSLSLPSFGVLEGLTNQALPCGYIDTSALMYTPHSSDMREDFILVKIYYHGQSRHNQTTVYVVLPIQMELSSTTNKTDMSISVLPRKELFVHQVATTPIPPTLLSLDDLFQILPSLSEQHTIFRYTFPVLPTGSFHSIDGTSINVTHTEFTSEELLQGIISFYPCDILFAESALTTEYAYNVTTLAGVLVAVGNVSVVSRYNHSRPTQRTNNPLPTVEGGIALIDSRTIDFYLLGKCVTYGVMQIAVPPQHGYLKFLNGDYLNDSVMQIDAVKNGTVLMYEHSGDESIADCAIWTVGCLSQPVLQVSMSILVVPVNDIPPHILGKPSITVYHSWAIPITPSLLHVSDVDSSNNEVVVNVVQSPGQHQTKGVVVKFTKEPTDDKGVITMPFLDVNYLLNVSSVSSELSFTLAEMKSYSIWYVPPKNASNDTIDLILSDLNNEMYVTDAISVTINNRNLKQTLYLSTNSSYPALLQNKPLPLHTHLGIYITSSYLYSIAEEHSSEYIVYFIRTPPSNGLLCHVSQVPCYSSAFEFTQHNIDMQEMVYFPNSNSPVDDSFEFEITLNGIQQYDSHLHTFNMSVIHKETTISSEEIFWIGAGNEKAIAPKFFRPFRKALSRNPEFTVTTPPHYGRLVMKQGDNTSISHPQSFTFNDLLQRRLLYKNYDSAYHMCSDQFTFSVSDEANALTNRTFLISIKDGPSKLKISFKPRTLQGQTRFVLSREDFNVTSPFCPDFVQFILTSPPSMGTLSLVDAKYNTLLQLEANSTFTARDVYSGLLRYNLLSMYSSSSGNFDEFALTASDPINEWPAPGLGQPRILPGSYNASYENIGHFMVYFIPPPPAVTHVLEVRITSPRPLTWLPDYGFYGHIITENEITVLNSSLQAKEVLFQVEIGPVFGTLMTNMTPAYIFTMQDVLDGIVWYRSTERHEGISSVFFQLVIYASLLNYSKKGAEYNYVIQWATVQMEQTTITVPEHSGVVNIVLRRTGATWFESHVLFTTLPRSATAVNNCTQPRRLGDFCNVTQVVVFPINVVSMTVPVPILDDNEAENEEMFIVSISEPYDAVLNRYTHTNVYITDEADYATISIGPTNESGNIHSCASQRLTRVFENVGILSLKLIRRGNLGHRVGVVCYTEGDVATEDDDYIARDRNSNSSIVWFTPNQTTAYCNVSIVNDTDYESSELFFVQLGNTIGYATANTSTFPACVFINSDRNDEPVVKFKESEVVIQESTTEEVHAQFTLLRNGTDLTQTTLVRYYWRIRDGDKAEVDKDFALFPSGSDRCGVNRDGCVEFTNGQTMATLAVKILHDNLLEGNESFHLSISVQTIGRKGTPSLLKVTILDGEEPATIQFTEHIYVFNESKGLIQIPIVRSGYTDGESKVECHLKQRTAIGGRTLGTNVDFLATEPEKLTFRKNQTELTCQVFLENDEIYERREDFRIQLRSGQDFGVNLPPNTSVATVFIEDPEDMPTIQFNTTMIWVDEPLTNYAIDSANVTLTLLRTGDLAFTSSLMYILVNGTAQAGIDFQNSSGRVQFQPGETAQQISIQLRANKMSNHNTSFTVKLVVLETEQDVRVGEIGAVMVMIANCAESGPFFPDIPWIGNIHQQRIMHADQQSLFYDLPLECITPCSPYALSQHDGNCHSEGINHTSTIYYWEISLEGTVFHQIQLSTVFTNTNNQILDTVYLKPNVLVRCSTQAVNHAGVKGHIRTSDVVNVTREFGCNNPENKMEATMTSYSNFKGNDKDLVHLVITLPHQQNTLPLVSTQQITAENVTHILLQEPSNEQIDHPTEHICSNMNTHTETSILTVRTISRTLHVVEHQPLYYQLDRTNCAWRFSLWMPISTLLSKCGAQRLPRAINITIHTAYYHIDLKQGIRVHNISAMTTSIAYIPGTTPFLPVPLHTLAENSTSGDSALIYPIAVENVDHTSTKLVYFYTRLPFFEIALFPSNNSESKLTLLHTKSTAGYELFSQAWLLESDSDTLNFTIELETLDVFDADIRLYEFWLMLMQHFNEYAPYLMTKIRLYTHEGMNGTKIEPLEVGDTLFVSMELDPIQVLQPGFALRIYQIQLCNDHRCNNAESVLMDGTINSKFNLQYHDGTPTKNKTIFSISTDTIIMTSSPSIWRLIITYGANTSDGRKLNQITEQRFTLQTPTFQPTTVNESYTTQLILVTQQSSNYAYLYASVAILITALVSVALGFSVIGIMIWIARVKHGLRKKMTQITDSQKESISKKHTVLNSMRDAQRRSYMTSPNGNLRRTHSTIGFPTAEKYRRQKQRRGKTSRTGTEIDASMSRVTSTQENIPPRSCSLPNLSVNAVPSTNEQSIFPEPQRRSNLNQVHSRVQKLVNTERSSLNRLVQQQLKVNRDAENLRIVQEMASKRKNYGVNEGKQGSEKKKGRTALASYAVRSLAASAKTPEPGSRPSTEL